MYRNNLTVNRMYRREVEGTLDYQNVFTSSKVYAFDEWGVSRKWKYLYPDKMYDEIIFDDIHCLKSNFISSQKMDDSREANFKYCTFLYDEGKLFRYYFNKITRKIEKSPSCYVHFQKRDMIIEQGDINLSKYLIIPNKFIHFQNIDINFLRKYCGGKLFYKKYSLLSGKSSGRLL